MDHPSRIRFLTFLALACLLSLFSTGVIAELASQDAESSLAPDESARSGPPDEAISEGIPPIGNHLLSNFIQSGVVVELQPQMHERETFTLSAPRSPPR